VLALLRTKDRFALLTPSQRVAVALAQCLPAAPDLAAFLPNQCSHILQGHGFSDRMWMAWAADGRCLATSRGDHAIQIWDPASGACSHTLSGHNGSVHAIARSPDGRQLASAGADRTIRLWTHHDPILVDVAEVLRTPFLHFEQRHWSKLATVHGHTLPTAEWGWIRPWLAFIHALGQMIRRFDVDVEKTTPQQQDSPFAVLLDG